MNLYIFNESSRAAVYGIGTYIRELTNALKDSSVNIHILHLNSDFENIIKEKKEGISHWYFPSPQPDNQKINRIENQGDYYCNVVYLLRLYITNTEQLIFHLNFNQSKVLAEKLKETFSCRILTVVHYAEWALALLGNLSHLNTILANKQPNDYEKFIQGSVANDKSFYSTVDHIACPSKYIKDMLCKEYKLDQKNISVVPNGLDDALSVLENKEMIQKKWLISDKEKLIVFAGRLDDIKGLEYLIKAFREVLKSFPDSRLIIAGDGAYDNYLKESKDICLKITYTGLLNKTELNELYRIADIGVVPSLHESFGYVAVEMMMYCLPVVATATSGLNEIVEDGISGLTVPVFENPDKVEINHSLLAEKISYLLQHPEKRKEMGSNGRKRYEQLYTSEVMRLNMLKLYHSLYNE